MGWMGCLLGMKEYVNKELDSKIFIENNVYKKLLMLQNERQKNSNQFIQSKLEKEYEAKLSQKALEIKELQANKEQEIISLGALRD